ncbi:MAG: TIGR04325 family methyltransferase [Chloroflexota bacterium]|nr:TIGR04325 family methyltransferase [Chloroflexota bacterium]
MRAQLARDLVTLIPPLQALRKRRYERAFRSHLGLVRGVFTDFEQARRSAPAGKPVGMDSPEYVDHHTDRADYIQAYDYPFLFWLERILVRSARVFDFGGNVGVHYFAYAPYLAYPPDLSWVVCELPNIVRDGERIALERQAHQLTFTTRFGDAEAADVLIASGALQYVEQSLEEMLGALRCQPRHLLLNKLPLYDGEPFVTLQNGGPVFAPQHVFNRAELLGALQNLGYELVNAWDVPGFSCFVPFQAGRAVRTYSGLYLRLASTGATVETGAHETPETLHNSSST